MQLIRAPGPVRDLRRRCRQGSHRGEIDVASEPGDTRFTVPLAAWPDRA